MATLDGFAPYATGMTAREAVEALHAARNISTNGAKIINSDTAPVFSDVSNEITFWYNTETNRLYRAHLNTTDNIVMWFEV